MNASANAPENLSREAAPARLFSGSSLSHISYAGFWLRLGAALIDLLILALPLAVFVSFLSVAMSTSQSFLSLKPGMSRSELLSKFGPNFLTITLVFFLLLSWLYFAILESSLWNATAGKRMLNIYVTDLRGSRISFARASVRFFTGRLLLHVPGVALYYCLVEFACIGLTPRKQAVHDMIASSLVLRGKRGTL